MNILGPVALEFIKELKLSLKGWRIEPYLTSPVLYPNLPLALCRPPKSKSAVNYFTERLKGDRSQDDECYLVCRRPKSELRLVRLVLEITTIQLCRISYYRANGWKQNQFSTMYASKRFQMGSGGISYEFNPDSLVFQVVQFHHFMDGPSKRKPTVLLKHAIDLADERSLPRVALLAAAVLEKSFGKVYYVRGDVKIGHYDGEIGVNVDGKNRILYQFPSNTLDHLTQRLLT
jgi:hypothetical protein